MRSELIETAAVRVHQGLTYGPLILPALVFDVPRPLRHDAAIRAACSALRIDHMGENHDQGFVTSRGRFVGREEAGEIALASGQTQRKLESLTSEDVW